MPSLLAFAGIPRVPTAIFCWKSEQGEWASNFHKRLGTGTALPLNSGHLTEADQLFTLKTFIADDDMTTSQNLFADIGQELPEIAATVEKTKDVLTQPNSVCLPQTMQESPIQSFVIQPANPKTGC